MELAGHADSDNREATIPTVVYGIYCLQHKSRANLTAGQHLRRHSIDIIGMADNTPGDGACVHSTAPEWVADKKPLKSKRYIYQSIRGRYRQHSGSFRYNPKGMICVGNTNRPANRTKLSINIRQLRFIYISAIAECRHRQRQYDHSTRLAQTTKRR